MALALGDHGADDPARVVDRDEPLELDAAGLGVDADDGDVRAERERAGLRLEVALDGELGRAGRSRRGARRARPRSATARALPVTWKRPPSRSSTTSAGFASSSSATSCFARSTTSADACAAAVPPICSDFEPYVPPPRATIVGVARDDGDRVEVEPELVGDDLRVRRLVALPVGERAGAEDRAAVGRDLDRAELGLGAAVRHLDVHRQADAELTAGRRSRAAAPARRAGRRSRPPRARARAPARSRPSRR